MDLKTLKADLRKAEIAWIQARDRAASEHDAWRLLQDSRAS